MEITFLWSWASFFVGVVATVLLSFLVMLVIAGKNYRNQKQAMETMERIKRRA